jgi:hypothetical protein
VNSSETVITTDMRVKRSSEPTPRVISLSNSKASSPKKAPSSSSSSSSSCSSSSPSSSSSSSNDHVSSSPPKKSGWMGNLFTNTFRRGGSKGKEDGSTTYIDKEGGQGSANKTSSDFDLESITSGGMSVDSLERDTRSNGDCHSDLSIDDASASRKSGVVSSRRLKKIDERTITVRVYSHIYSL